MTLALAEASPSLLLILLKGPITPVRIFYSLPSDLAKTRRREEEEEGGATELLWIQR